jgi:hypothetical protein
MVVGGGLKGSGTDLTRGKLWENENTHIFLVRNKKGTFTFGRSRLK